MRECSLSDPSKPRILWVGYNTLEEGINKGLYIPGEAWTFDLVLNFDRRCDEVTYVVPFGKASVSLKVSPGIHYEERRLPLQSLPQLARLIWALPGAVRWIRRLISDLQPDAIVVSGPHLPALVTRLATHRGRPLRLCFIEAFWETLLDQQSYIPPLIRRALPYWYRWVYTWFDAYQGTPSLDPDYYIERGMREDRIFPWSQPIDRDALLESASSRPLQVPSDLPRPWVISVGRLHAEKLVLDSVDVLSNMVEAGFSGTMIIVGDGPEREAVLEKASHLGVAQSLWLTGHLSLPDAFALLLEADAYFAPMQGSALIEALGASLPIVAYDHTTHRVAMTDPDAGVLVPNRDSARAAAELLKILEDPELTTSQADASAACFEKKYAKEVLAERNFSALRCLLR